MVGLVLGVPDQSVDGVLGGRLADLVFLLIPQRPVVAVRRFHAVRVIQQVDLVAVFVGEIRADPDVFFPLSLAMPAMDTKLSGGGTTIYSFSPG